MTEPRFFKAENNARNAEEFKRCLPMGVQTSFVTMAPAIATAEQLRIKPLLGVLLFDTAANYYAEHNASGESDVMNGLVQLLQMAVVRLAAWDSFAELAVMMTDSGVSNNQGEKRAYRYETDALRETLRRQGYEYVNKVLEHCSKHIEDLPDFEHSYYYATRKDSMIRSMADFERFVGIGHDFCVFARLREWIDGTEAMELPFRIGESLLAKLKENRDSDTYRPILSGVMAFVAHWSMAEAAPFLNIMPTAQGLMVVSEESRQGGSVMSDKKNTESFKVGNNIDSLTKAIHKVAKKFGVEKSEMLICAENTGKYVYPLAVTCKAEGVFLWIENAYYISLYAKKQRGKNDSVDAFRIADYARKNQDDAKQFELPAETMARLKQLLHLQQDFDLLVSKYNAKIKDCESYMPDEVYKESCVYWRNISDNAREQSEIIEKKIAQIIAEDKTLSRQDYLLQTIPGIGRKTSHVMIAATSGFTVFTDGRKFSCHAGVAPFSYESGTSIKSGTHISHRANMRLKCSVHIAAHIAASICKNGPIHEYYLRKIAEGKNKMVVLNNCRAKLITIMFAVIRDNTPFDPNHEYRAK